MVWQLVQSVVFAIILVELFALCWLEGDNLSPLQVLFVLVLIIFIVIEYFTLLRGRSSMSSSNILIDVIAFIVLLSLPIAAIAIAESINRFRKGRKKDD